MDYIRFFLNNKRFISFGFLLTFFSSFGQTFLISLYVPDLIKDFQLTNSAFGGLYAIATLGSSFILVYAGKLIDTSDLRKYTFYSSVTLLTACLILAFSQNIIFILIGLLGLRLAGQGLLSHISVTSVSKHFEETRGKALSITTLGHSLGEGVFPIILALLIGIVGWRNSMIINALIIATVLLPFIWFALKKYSQPVVNQDNQTNKGYSRWNLLKEENFYLIAFNSSVLPFLVTGLIFYQLVLAEDKGWAVEWLSFCFIGFAIGRIVFSLISGKMIDKFSAVRIFPYYLLPFALGLILLLTGNHPYIAFAYLTLTGISVGLGATIKTAAVAEIYGNSNLGGVRSIFSTITVVSTALSPLLFGYMLDSGFHFSSIILFSLVLVIVVSLSGLKLSKNYKLNFEIKGD